MRVSRAVLLPAASLVALAAVLLVACNASDPGEPSIAHKSSAVEVGAWTLAAGPSTPVGERNAPAMAWDSARNRIVLFGGDTTTEPYASATWEWDGSAWTIVATTGPSPRTGARMVYDSARKRMVLFGGFRGTTELGDTWEWDGSAWNQVASTGPTPRNGFAMAYDATTGQTLLFGGTDSNGNQADTWAWDGTSWTQLNVTGPVLRTGTAMVYDPVRGRVVLFGGENGSGTLADTWEWDGSTWTERKTTISPPGRSWHGMAFDSVRGVTLVFAGRLSTQSLVSTNDLWAWNGSKWTQLCTSSACLSASPGVRSRVSMAFDPSRGVAAAYGSSLATADPYVYEWDGTTWQRRLSPTVAGSSAATFDSATSQVLLCNTGPIGSLSDTFAWTGTSWNRLASNGPTGNATLAFDSARSRDVLVATDAGGLSLPQVWEWSGSAWNQACTGKPCTNSVPQARAETTIAYDAARQQTVLFGGSTVHPPAAFFDDTWLWDGSTWKNVCSASNCVRPSPRYGHAMAYDANRSRIVLFGGNASGTLVNDTWEWDGSTWTQMATTGPSPREEAAMTYDSTRKRIILFGGGTVQGTTYGDTWEWDGSTWTQMATTGPAPRKSYPNPLAYDPTQKTPVAVGVWGDTWTYHTRGSTCSTTADCVYGTCVDGVCCDSSVCGTCQTCADPTNPGVCSPVKNAPDPDTCTGVSSCNALGQCTRGDGKPCSAGTDCASGFCVDGVCCNTACNSACDVCAAALGAPADGTCGPAPAGAPGDGSCAPFACPGTATTCATACLSDNVCAPDAYCAPGGVCKPEKAQGAACNPTAGADCLVDQCRVCATGNCVDGVCCDTACSGSCDVCSQALGASADGTCTPAAAGSTGSPACFPGVCNGTSASCSMNCTSNTDCPKNAYCQGGTCQGSLANGEACTSPLACANGNCADGVCCDTACDGPCEVCNKVKGTCTAVSGDPPAGHPSCPATTPGDPCSQTACDGKDGTACKAYVSSNVTCRTASCTKGQAIVSAVCDGSGNCPAAHPQPCAPYACGATTCKTQCTGDSDCDTGYHCDVPSGNCQNGAICDGDHTITKAGGVTQDCSPYHCTSDGTCATSCKSTADCVGTTVCDDTGQCKQVNVKSANNAGGCGCRTSGPAKPTGGAFAVGLLLLFDIRRRGRRRKGLPARRGNAA